EPRGLDFRPPGGESPRDAARQASAAAAVALGAVYFAIRSLEPDPVAILIEAEGCRWAGSELPTLQGSPLPPGTLNLVEGIATLAFHSGAVVSLEAPVSLEIVSPMLCRLVAGSVVAEVPESAHGFTITTPDMRVIDHGTRFGVTANELGQSQVFVFEGLIEVDSPASAPEPRMLKTGQSIRLDARPGADAQELSQGGDPPLEALAREGWVVIPTSSGRGKDSFVRQEGKRLPHGVEPLVMVKHSTVAEGNQRKGYFGFDLSSLPAGARIEEAEFVLEVERSGLGFAVMVPDSRFTVYGLTDEDGDLWEEQALFWNNAPANTETGNTLDPDKVTKLGSFQIRKGAGSGRRSIGGEELVAFLNSDTNGLATLIVVRETDESDSMGLVHAFASREHPHAMPPSLRLRTR
ncbi:MAG: DNRLRE domain-containing protein, partial [Verrucomicrobiales bacterium]